jgi:cAMP phosphodiesterase
MIPEIPDTLTYLCCYYNPLTSLPVLPVTITHIYSSPYTEINDKEVLFSDGSTLYERKNSNSINY